MNIYGKTFLMNKPLVCVYVERERERERERSENLLSVETRKL